MKRTTFFAALFAAFTLVALPFSASAQSQEELENLSYALGVLFGNNLMQQGIDGIDAASLAQGLTDKMNGNPSMSPEEANALVTEIMTSKKEAADAEYRTLCESFLAENAKKSGISVTESGLQYRHETVGTGESPTAESTVEVHYRGTLIDGTEFDSSYKRGETISFPLNGVIPGWTEGLQLMKEGGKTTFWIPQALAYGARPNPNGPIPPYAALIFEVELISIQ